MSDWKPKRFWKTAVATTCDGGFTVELDGRSVKTPAKAMLIVPTLPMAEAIAAEWDAQGDHVDPLSMPITRGANAAIDKVRTQHAEVAAMLAEYGDSDLLCYRAAGPDTLIARQADAWDPLLDWAAQALDARLTVGEGVIHIDQNPDVLARLRAAVFAFDEFALAAAHDLISISGSLILGLAVTRDAVDPEHAWTVSRVDEHWQIEQWGHDDEASALEVTKRAAFLDAVRFYRLSQP
jgi:chaperone required for assembly of F1-ATPase